MVHGSPTDQAGAMTTIPPDASGGAAAGPHEGPRVTRDEVRDLTRLRRSRSDRKIAGVAGGIARYLDIDPLLVRVALVVLVFFGGASLLLYAAVWLLVPEEGSDRARINLDERSRTVTLAVVGLLALLVLLGDSWGAFRFPWPLAVLGLVVLWLVTRDGSRRTQVATPPPGAPPAPGQVGPVPAGYPGATGPADLGSPGGPARPDGPAGPPWTPPPAYVPPPPAPPDPRRRGPRLFGATLALIALALGVLGMVDLAGADLPPATYPALAVAVCGAMLLLGAFWGRAGGVILIGLIGSAALVGTAAGDHWDGDWGDKTVITPASAADLGGYYSFDAGQETIDLRSIADIRRLDGRIVAVDGSVGQVTVLVPRGLGVAVDASIDGPGSIEAFGHSADGWGVARVWRQGSPSEPLLRVVVNLSVGHVEVRES